MSIKITVYPGGETISCLPGVRMHEALAHMGYAVRTPCGGNGTCGKCLVWVTPGQSAENVRQEGCQFQQICACQYVVRESLLVRLSEESLRQDAVQILTTHPSLDVLSTNLQSQTGDGGQYAVAVDLGTTTIVAELLCRVTRRSCGVQSCRNPQAEFGDDVITRIQYASESPEHASRLRMAVVDAINGLIASLICNVVLLPEDISLVTIAGNTTMQQLFAGLDVKSLGHSPFEPATKRYHPTPAHLYDIEINHSGLVVLFPVIGGFVGGDLVAGIIATQLCSQTAPSLLIDIGTNGEIILWRPEGRLLLASATAAGPAFEGARVSQGMIAAPGAIERVVIGDTLHVETIGNQPARGICGSGLIDLLAELLRVGAVTSSGKLLCEGVEVRGEGTGSSILIPLPSPLPPHPYQPAFVVVPQNESGIGGPILLTQHDIRQVQLAAGAIRAGVTLLLRQAGLQPGDLANVFLAGGFGNYIRRENAQRIGLLPPEIPTERIQFCGNTSLAGTKVVLLNAACYDAMQHIADTAVCVDLSNSPDFAAVFAESMLF